MADVGNTGDVDIDAIPTRKLPAADATLATARLAVDELPTQKVVAVATDAPPTSAALSIPDVATVPNVAVPAAKRAQALQRLRPPHLSRFTLPDALLRRPKLRYALLAVLALVVVSLPLLHAFASGQRGTSIGVVRPIAHATAIPNAPSTATSVPTGTPGTVGTRGWISPLIAAAQVGYVNNLISHMSLDEEIGQMIMIEFQESQMTPGIAYEISHYHVGSVILYAYNVQTPEQTRALTQALQASATLPLLISTDQEGGPVNRLYGIDGPLPSAEEIGTRNDVAYAQQRGEQDASELLKLGINTNLAPVVDVQNIPDGEGALGGRMFGTTPEQVTTMAGAYLTGLQDTHQVVGTLKHFPGLGDVPVDPHLTLPTLDRSLSDLQRIDWAPYASLIASGQAQMVMVTHEMVPAVDPVNPSSLSRPLITGVLRDQLHFNGVIVTDGIYMKSLSATIPLDQIVLRAVEAGVDIISSTYSLATTDTAERVIRDAVQNGTVSKQQIDDSVRRILLLKLRYGVLSQHAASAGA